MRTVGATGKISTTKDTSWIRVVEMTLKQKAKTKTKWIQKLDQCQMQEEKQNRTDADATL